MNLVTILDRLNSIEKGSFLKIINNLLAAGDNTPEIESILSSSGSNIKNADSVQVTKIFEAVSDRFICFIMDEYTKASSQLDILLNIITRDGNSIMRLDWFTKLYEEEVRKQHKAIETFKADVNADKPTLEESRIRDYKTYAACLKTAYCNDKEANLTPKITSDEQSILNSLSNALELSQDEMTMLKYSVLGIKKNSNIDDVVNELKDKGLIFFSKKNNMIYAADEVISVARKIRGKEVADKFFRRTLLKLKEPQINMVCRKHGIDAKMSFKEKVDEIISSGVSFSSVLREDIYKADVKLTDRKKFISELCDDKLMIEPAIKGLSLDDKINNLISYFDKRSTEEKMGISTGGYEALLTDMAQYVQDANKTIRKVFQMQEDNVMKQEYLTEYNIMPRDILELFTNEELAVLCGEKNIKMRGDLVLNILESYKDNDNLLVENYENIGFRNLNALKENNVIITEAELGVKFEEVTKYILTKLGLNVDEELRKKLNTDKDKMDILVRSGDNNVVLVECKTVKENGYNKFSAISRQVRSYKMLLEKNGFTVDRILIVAPDFSDDFVAECADDFSLPITLVRAQSLSTIYKTVKETGSNRFSIQMLSRDLLIQDDRIVRALKK